MNLNMMNLKKWRAALELFPAGADAIYKVRVDARLAAFARSPAGQDEIAKQSMEDQQRIWEWIASVDRGAATWFVGQIPVGAARRYSNTLKEVGCHVTAIAEIPLATVSSGSLGDPIMQILELLFASATETVLEIDEVEARLLDAEQTIHGLRLGLETQRKRGDAAVLELKQLRDSLGCLRTELNKVAP